METATIQQQEYPGRGLILKLIYCAGVALFAVLFLWNFWSTGPYALGMNAFVFFSLLLGVFIRVLHIEGKYGKHDLLWIIPFALIIASFAIYDNPFLKMAAIVVLPPLFALFYNSAFLADKNSVYWNQGFIIHICVRILSLLGELGNSA
ncbi:MAG: hypothetical protein HYW88_02240, partial [Candidatus Sungbacteria bacterium]|nr:hypothetical protein [Candidatus Sungbacteria bacterium]